MSIYEAVSLRRRFDSVDLLYEYYANDLPIQSLLCFYLLFATIGGWFESRDNKEGLKLTLLDPLDQSG